jgi:DNA-binding CsgD family transcriptional regulator
VEQPDIFAFSGFIADLTALAARACPAAFRTDALQLLRSQVGFSAAIWGTAGIGAGLSFREVLLFDLPTEAVGAIESSASADPRLMQVLGSPGVAHAYSISAHDPPALRAEVERWDIGHIMSIAAFDAELGLANGIVLLRPTSRGEFRDRDRIALEAGFPHLLRTWAENQIHALQREIDAGSGQPRYAAISHHGILAAADDEFLRLFRLEWPNWRGPLLPDAVRGLLLAEDAARICGQCTILTVRHGHDVSLLQIRLRVVADDLRPRERAVAELCAQGASYRDIAVALGIAPATARNHIAAVHRRLGVNRNAAIASLLAQAL